LHLGDGNVFKASRLSNPLYFIIAAVCPFPLKMSEDSFYWNGYLPLQGALLRKDLPVPRSCDFLKWGLYVILESCYSCAPRNIKIFGRNIHVTGEQLFYQNHLRFFTWLILAFFSAPDF